MTPPMTPEQRRAERNRLFLVGLLPSLIALAVAAQLFLLAQGNRAARGQYDDGDHASATESFLGLRDLGMVQPWVAPFGAGTAAYRDGELADAAKHFEAALSEVPTEQQCLVRENLALTHLAAAKEARKESRAAAGIELRKAREAIDVYGCDEDLLDGIDDQISKLDGGSAQEPKTEKEKLDELEKRNQQARKREQQKDEPVNEPDVQVHW